MLAFNPATSISLVEGGKYDITVYPDQVAFCPNCKYVIDCFIDKSEVTITGVYLGFSIRFKSLNFYISEQTRNRCTHCNEEFASFAVPANLLTKARIVLAKDDE